jgi:hypothetical protein
VLTGRSVAQVVFLLYGGVLADRMSRYRLMILSDLTAFLAQACVAASVAGAVIAGLLAATVGPGWGLAVDALTFLLSALFLLGVRVPNPGRSAPAMSVGLLTELRQGWQEFRSRQ